MSDEGKPYKVGYKAPPPEHRFRKGQSGNPRGRPPKEVRAILPRQYRRDIIRLCETETRIRTAEGDLTVSVVEAVLRRLVHKAMQGHGPSIRRVIDEYRQAVKERPRPLIGRLSGGLPTLHGRRTWSKACADRTVT